jgi:hypothetical protein
MSRGPHRKACEREGLGAPAARGRGMGSCSTVECPRSTGTGLTAMLADAHVTRVFGPILQQ